MQKRTMYFIAFFLSIIVMVLSPLCGEPWVYVVLICSLIAGVGSFIGLDHETFKQQEKDDEPDNR